MSEIGVETLPPMSKAEIAQAQVQSNYRALERLFLTPNPQGAPRVGILEGGKIDFFPQITSSDAAKIEPAIDYVTNFSAGTYHGETNTIIVKSERADRHFLSHETTHSVVKVEDPQVKLKADSFEGFDGFYPGFGKLLQSLASDTHLSEFSLDMNEFFPPMGEAYLLGDNSESNLERWKQQFDKVSAMTKPEDLQKKAGFTKALIEHLPELAGELLVRSKGGDIYEILRNNPNLTHLKGQEIWEKYCLPALTTPSIKPQQTKAA